MSPLVSVVIPAYNEADRIGEALDSVRLQTLTDHEIIVVNDGSTDETARTVETYFAEHSLPNARLVSHETNRQAAVARNTGIREAQGELIAFLDADDVWYPEKLVLTIVKLPKEFHK